MLPIFEFSILLNLGNLRNVEILSYYYVSKLVQNLIYLLGA